MASDNERAGYVAVGMCVGIILMLAVWGLTPARHCYDRSVAPSPTTAASVAFR